MIRVMLLPRVNSSKSVAWSTVAVHDDDRESREQKERESFENGIIPG